MFRGMIASVTVMALCGCASTARMSDGAQSAIPPPQFLPAPAPPPEPPPPSEPFPPMPESRPPLHAMPPVFGGGGPAPPVGDPGGSAGRNPVRRVPVSGAGPSPEPMPVLGTRAPGPNAGSAAPPAAAGCDPRDLDCNASVLGRGSFAKAPEMWVGEPAELEFAVGLTDAAVERELLPDDSPARVQDVNIGRCMRVTLEPNAHFDITGANGEIRRLSRDMGRASWRWTVMPTRAGKTGVSAKVEVLKRSGDTCTGEQYDEYTERVTVDVQIGWWDRFLVALGEAKGVGDVFSALFKSWETALIALAALITAFGGVVGAFRGLSPKGRERRATKKAERAARRPRRKAQP